MIYVREARYAGGHSLWLRFSNGEEGVAELGDLIDRYAIAAELQDPTVFRNFSLDEWPTVVWPCGFDVSPELLYELATGKSRSWPVATEGPAA